MVTNSNLDPAKEKLMKSFFALEDALNTLEDLSVSSLEHLSVRELFDFSIRVASLARHVRLHHVVTHGDKLNKVVTAAKPVPSYSGKSRGYWVGNSRTLEFRGTQVGSSPRPDALGGLIKTDDESGIFGGLITFRPPRVEFLPDPFEIRFWDNILEALVQMKQSVLGRQNVEKIFDKIFRSRTAEDHLNLRGKSSAGKRHFYHKKKKS